MKTQRYIVCSGMLYRIASAFTLRWAATGLQRWLQSCAEPSAELTPLHPDESIADSKSESATLRKRGIGTAAGSLLCWTA